jgi:hypothetical protein
VSPAEEDLESGNPGSSHVGEHTRAAGRIAGRAHRLPFIPRKDALPHVQDEALSEAEKIHERARVNRTRHRWLWPDRAVTES